MTEIISVGLIFFIIALASKQFGSFFAQARLPLITGFLFMGMIVGPDVLGLIKSEFVHRLRFVDQISLGIIAFAAGAELHMKELKPRLKSIGWNSLTQLLAIFGFGVAAVMIFADYFPFIAALPSSGRWAVALLVGAIMVARSPSSAIAVITETRAKGVFTSTVLGVTVVTDVLVITTFAISASVAAALVDGTGIELSFVGFLALEIAASVVSGYLLGRVLSNILSASVYHFAKVALVVVLGYGVFVLAEALHHYSVESWSHTFSLEPLLICMVAGFVVTNFTSNRQSFHHLLEQVSPPVYVAFFTLTGASLSLSVLETTWSIALVLVAVRLLGIITGAWVGGSLAGDAPRHRRLAFLGYVTQAGVGLGLAKTIEVRFPEWGLDCATAVIAAIIINQIVGPPLMKWVLNLVGETHTRPQDDEPYDGEYDAVVFGLAHNAYLLAQQLRAGGWQVRIAAHTHVPLRPDDPHDLIHYLDDFGRGLLERVETHRAEAVVCLFADDEDSYQVCQTIREHFEVSEVVVRLNDASNLERFTELEVTVVEPTMAMLNLLDHLVRAPAATSLILGTVEDHDIVDLELRDADLDGRQVRDLRIPADVVILSINRRGQTITPHGDTDLELGDLITLVGSTKGIERAGLLFDVGFPIHRPLIPSLRAGAPRHGAALEREGHRETDPRDPQLSRYAETELMRAQVKTRDKLRLFELIGEVYAASHDVDPSDIEQLVWAREREQCTFVGDGLAIPHATSEVFSRTHLGIVTLAEPIWYGEGERVDVVVFMLGPLGDRPTYLKLLGRCARLCMKADLLDRLRGCQTPAELQAMLVDTDRGLAAAEADDDPAVEALA